MANRKNNNNKRKTKVITFNFSWIYLVLILGMGLLLFSNSGTPAQKVEWAQVQQMVREGDVKEIHFIRNDFKGNVTIKPEKLSKYTNLFPGGELPKKAPHFFFLTSTSFAPETEFAQLNDAISEVGVAPVKVVMENDPKVWGNVLQWVVPILFFIFLWSFMFRGLGKGPGGAGGQGGMNPFNVGKAQGKEVDKEKVNVTFKDVAGLYGAKEEVMEIVDFLKNPKKYTTLGGKIPKGALLVGPPGTGKTLLAKAVAGEAKVPFFSISGSDFVEMFVGVGASRVRDLFAQAKQKAPCIVFIDEIDAVGRARGKNAGFSGNDERENTLNQLLTEMDGFGTNSGVIVLAATNRADILDKALMRAGRFDRQIHVTLPDLNERKEIFAVHLKGLKVAPDFDVEKVAKHTPGFSGADIANVCNEAALTAARKNKDTIDEQDFMDASDRIVGGIERKKTMMSPQEKRLTAYHEAGHALTGWKLEGCDPVLKVTIIPRGSSLGATWFLPDEKVTESKSDMLDNMCSLVAGRVAEQMVNDGVPCSGALSDFERMTKMAYAMVKFYGMSDKVGNLSFYDSTGTAGYDFTKPFSEKTAELIDSEVKSIVDSVTKRAKEILESNRDALDTLAGLLIDKEFITAEEIESVLGPKAGKHGEDRLKEDKAENTDNNTEAADE